MITGIYIDSMGHSHQDLGELLLFLEDMYREIQSLKRELASTEKTAETVLSVANQAYNKKPLSEMILRC